MSGQQITRASTALRRGRDIIAQGWCRNQFGITARKGEPERPDRFCELGGLYDGLNARWVFHPNEEWNLGVRTVLPGGTFTPKNFDRRLARQCEKWLAIAIIEQVKTFRPHGDSVRSSMIRRLQAQYEPFTVASSPHHGDIIANHNDFIARNRADVIAVYDRAIELARKYEQRVRKARSRSRRGSPFALAA